MTCRPCPCACRPRQSVFSPLFSYLSHASALFLSLCLKQLASLLLTKPASDFSCGFFFFNLKQMSRNSVHTHVDPASISACFVFKIWLQNTSALACVLLHCNICIVPLLFGFLEQEHARIRSYTHSCAALPYLSCNSLLFFYKYVGSCLFLCLLAWQGVGSKYTTWSACQQEQIFFLLLHLFSRSLIWAILKRYFCFAALQPIESSLLSGPFHRIKLNHFLPRQRYKWELTTE